MKPILILLSAAACLAPFARADDLAIIVAKSVAIDNVTSDDLGRIFRCEKTDGPNGVKLTIYNREKGAPERQVVLKEIYHMNDGAYSRFFMQAVFTGALTSAPKIISGAAAMKRLAADNPGAVTYVFASQVDDSVKALKIDGLAPGDPGYPLKPAP
jgi:phosphate transport system substrate-binding protein